MIEYESYVKEELPEKLDDEELKTLWEEFAATRSSEIRSILIERNCRLCAKYAMMYCSKYHILNQLEDVYSECKIALVKAIDAFEVNRDAKFSTFAYKCMDKRLYNLYRKAAKDALTRTEDIPDFYDGEENVDLENYMPLKDEKESSFTLDIADAEVLKDILSYIENLEDERIKIAIKMYYGLDGYEKSTYDEIGEELGVTHTTAEKLERRGINLIKVYLGKICPLSYPDIANGINRSRLQFSSKHERVDYIYNSYYGIGLPQKSINELAEELGMTYEYVNGVLSNMRDRNRKKGVPDIKREQKSKFTDEQMSDIFNAYYGLNGNEITATYLIIKNLHLDVSPQMFGYYFKKIISKYLNDGVYTQEQIDAFEEKRRKLLTVRVEDYAYEHDSYYGINGCEKKSQVQLAEELGTTSVSVGLHIEKYRKFLLQKNKEGM